MIWSDTTLSKALGITIEQSIQANNVQFNSQDVKHGDLFIALTGGNRDGHAYALDAINKGASVVIVSQVINNLPPEKMILVDDTTKALYKMAAYKRKNSKAKFIGVTGSVGKTSTKDAITTLLEPFAKVFASRGNFNNHLGLPISLASMPDDTHYGVFELGMNKAGEIRNISAILKPDIAVITSVSEVHLEFFNSVLDIVDAKCEIFENLISNGIAIVNLDNKYYGRIMLNLEKLNVKHIYTFGVHKDAMVRLALYEKINDKVNLKYLISNTAINVTLPLIPYHHAKNFATALAVVAALKLDTKIAAQQLCKIQITDGRGKKLEVNKGSKKFSIICDYYNSSPESLKASFEYLKSCDHANKVAIIGDMLELGASSVALHKSVVPYIIQSGVNKIFLIGTIIQSIKSLLPQNMKIISFDNVDTLSTGFDDLINGGELILIKGSRGMRLEKIMHYFEFTGQCNDL